MTTELHADTASAVERPRLNRSLRPSAKAPVRIVHLGLGAFHRSHQAWYTHHAGDAAGWGIAAFTGRRPDAALALAEQDGLYTVVERGDTGDSFATVSSIVEAVDGADVGRLAALVAAPATAVITLTITEAAYRLRADGSLWVHLDDTELHHRTSNNDVGATFGNHEGTYYSCHLCTLLRNNPQGARCRGRTCTALHISAIDWLSRGVRGAPVIACFV